MRCFQLLIIVSLAFILTGCPVSGRKASGRHALQVAYFQNLDFIEMQPVDPVLKRPAAPFIKVLKDGLGMDSIEMHLTDERHVTNAFRRIKGRFENMYAGTVSVYPCRYADTLILTNNKLYEYRACGSSGRANEQQILIYTRVAPDRIVLERYAFTNLIEQKQLPLPADTLFVPIMHRVEIMSPYATQEEYIIYRSGDAVAVRCRTLNSHFCREGYALHEWNYPFTGGLIYWSLIYHPFWAGMAK